MKKKNKILIMLLCVCFISLNMITGSGEYMHTVTMYSVDNDTITVRMSEIEAYENEGWFIEPVIIMYAPDGRTQYTLLSEVELYKTLGWYTEPVVLMFAADGRTMYVIESEVALYLNLNWFLSEKEARMSVINQNDLLLLARIINAEAAPHNYIDKCYVGAVVMNRLDSGLWGNSILSVISARGQYSSYKNSKFNTYPPQDCIDIALELLLGERYGMPKNVIFQSGGPQGTGIWQKVINGSGYYNHYYCYGNV